MASVTSVVERAAVHLLRVGRSDTSIARELFIDRRTVRRIRTTNGIVARSDWRAHPDAVREDALRRIAQGASRFAVSRALGVSRTTLCRWCDDAGVSYVDARRVA